jgi:catechol 2,3-dioxygenase-like lactoylglutathione lyase family enzyme
VDERPPVWVGHVALSVRDLPRSVAFWTSIGMRPVGEDERVAVLELRGGTHLVLLTGDATPGDAPFDLMVDDLDAAHADWQTRGLAPSAITRGHIHDSFTVTDPDGYVVTVHNSHVAGAV